MMEIVAGDAIIVERGGEWAKTVVSRTTPSRVIVKFGDGEASYEVSFRRSDGREVSGPGSAYLPDDRTLALVAKTEDRAQRALYIREIARTNYREFSTKDLREVVEAVRRGKRDKE